MESVLPNKALSDGWRVYLKSADQVFVRMEKEPFKARTSQPILTSNLKAPFDLFNIEIYRQRLFRRVYVNLS